MKTNGQIQLYPVLRVALFLIAGIVSGELLYGAVSCDAWFAATAVSLMFALLAYRRCVLQTVLIFLTCYFLGAMLVCRELDEVNMSVPGEDTAYSAVVVSQPVVAGKVVKCDLITVNTHRPMKIKASIYRDGRADRLRIGNGIEAVSLLEKPTNYAGTDFDYARYLLYHGYVATTFIYIDEWKGAAVDLSRLSVVQRARISALVFRDKLLQRFSDMGFSGQAYAVLAAMTLGDKSSLSDELKEEYSVSGASHVLALSGLHLGIIYAILSLLFSRRRWQIVSQVLILLAIWSYVFIVGMSASVVRSAVMLTVYSFVSLLNRNRLSLNTLSVAAVVILAGSPLYLYDVGFHHILSSAPGSYARKHPQYSYNKTDMADDGCISGCTDRSGPADSVLFWTFLMLFPPYQYDCSACSHSYPLWGCTDGCCEFPALASDVVGRIAA